MRNSQPEKQIKTMFQHLHTFNTHHIALRVSIIVSLSTHIQCYCWQSILFSTAVNHSERVGNAQYTQYMPMHAERMGPVSPFRSYRWLISYWIGPMAWAITPHRWSVFNSRTMLCQRTFSYTYTCGVHVPRWKAITFNSLSQIERFVDSVFIHKSCGTFLRVENVVMASVKCLILW